MGTESPSGSWLSRLPCRKNEIKTLEFKLNWCKHSTAVNRNWSQQFNLSRTGTWSRRPSIISWRMAGASLDQAGQTSLIPLQCRRREKKKKERILHLFRCYTHTQSFTLPLSHTTLSHTVFDTPLCHTPSFTHHFVKHHLSHTICHTPSLSHTIFYTPSLSRTIFYTPSPTHHLSHTIFHTPLCHTPSFTHIFITHHLSHTSLSHTIFHTPLCHVALVATSTFAWRGRRGAWWHPPSFCVTGVALMALGWLWWRAWACFSRRWRRGTLHGKHGTWWHPPSFCVAGVALGNIYLCHKPSLTQHLCHTPSFTHHVSHTTLSPTIFDTPSLTHHLCHTPSFTHHLCHTPSFTHHLCHTPSFTHHLSHTTLSNTIFHTPSVTHHLCHTPSLTHHLCHTPSFTHHFVTHHLWHTISHTPSLSHTIFHTPLCQTPSFTHHLSHTIFVTHHLWQSIFVTRHLSHTIFVTLPSFTHHLSHTTLSHTIFHTPLCHTTLSPTIFATPSFTHNFVTRSLLHTTFTHTIFHTQLCHTHTIFLCHTPSFTYNFVAHNFVLLLNPPPPPLSFLPSPSRLQHLVLIIGRSCLVGLSGPSIWYTLFLFMNMCLFVYITCLSNKTMCVVAFSLRFEFVSGVGVCSKYSDSCLVLAGNTFYLLYFTSICTIYTYTIFLICPCFYLVLHIYIYKLLTEMCIHIHL